MNDRRTFIRHLAVASAAAAICANGRAAVSTLLRSESCAALDSLGQETFASLRGSAFMVRGPGGATQSLVLAEVRRFEREAHVENFSLHFEGRGAAAFAQGMQRFTHPKLGSFDLFVVAHPIDAQTCGYEAVFNRLLS